MHSTIASNALNRFRVSSDWGLKCSREFGMRLGIPRSSCLPEECLKESVVEMAAAKEKPTEPMIWQATQSSLSEENYWFKFELHVKIAISLKTNLVHWKPLKHTETYWNPKRMMLHPVNVPIVGCQHCDFRRAKLSDGQISLLSPIMSYYPRWWPSVKWLPGGCELRGIPPSDRLLHQGPNFLWTTATGQSILEP